MFGFLLGLIAFVFLWLLSFLLNQPANPAKKSEERQKSDGAAAYIERPGSHARAMVRARTAKRAALRPNAEVRHGEENKQ